MVEPTPQFEQKITPEQEKEQLKEKIVEAPEKAKEILKEHMEREPEDVIKSSHLISPAQRKEMEKHLTDPHYREMKEQVGYLLRMADQHGILQTNVFIKKELQKNTLDLKVMDEFHDLYIRITLDQMKNA